MNTNIEQFETGQFGPVESILSVIAVFVIVLIVRFVWRFFSSKDEPIPNLDQEFLRLNAGHMLEQISYYKAANSRARISFLLSIIASTAGVGLIGLMMYKQHELGWMEGKSSFVALEAASSILCNLIGLVLWNNAKREKEDARKYFDCLRVDSGRYQAWLIINSFKEGTHRKKMETRLLDLLLAGNKETIPDISKE